ncbi:hypothetical protein LZC95_19260 [Pendulispora brunnea]|uniref:Uncharacterized protein n=1 Tax=Pendulispora brunnea TaxID=2905690 RepID=A0ABZ2KMP1_9BACT
MDVVSFMALCVGSPHPTEEYLVVSTINGLLSSTKTSSFEPCTDAIRPQRPSMQPLHRAPCVSTEKDPKFIAAHRNNSERPARFCSAFHRIFPRARRASLYTK